MGFQETTIYYLVLYLIHEGIDLMDLLKIQFENNVSIDGSYCIASSSILSIWIQYHVFGCNTI